MKKITLILVLLFIFTINTLAHSKFYIGDKVPNMYIEEYNDTNLHNGAPFKIIRDDGEFVYCINPFLRVNTDLYYEEYDYNASIFNFTEEKLDKLNVIAYLGYGYYTHQDIKWYGITQFLIWKEIGFTDIYFTDKYYGNRVNAYVEEVNELEEMVKRYYELPSFANEQFEYNPNSRYEIIDTNNTLSNYEILETNITAEIKNNKLIIDTTKNGEYEISFIKKSPIDRNYILYNLDNSQNLFYNGKIKDIIFKIKIVVNSGDITINKFDSENKSRIEASLEGAIYGIYQDDKLIGTITTDENGVGYIDYIPFGNYYVKEITPSKGYKLDSNIYYLSITKDNRNIIINSYENIIKGNLIINKFYGEDGKYEKESGAKFEIYDENNEFVDLLEVNESSNIMIPYGDYYLLQIDGMKGYKFIDKFKISIREEKDYIFNLYNEKDVLVVEVPNTLKYRWNKYIYIGIMFIGIILVFIEIIKERTTKRYC